ncbi:hypothetical protein [Cellulomonas soli]
MRLPLNSSTRSAGIQNSQSSCALFAAACAMLGDVATTSEALACLRCGRPVVLNREHYETFERMHYICFHFEYEHLLALDAWEQPR